MLPLSEIVRLRDTVDADWRSPVADAVAAAWGFRPGTALFWRSSARHVFVVCSDDRTQRVGFLRCAPAHLIDRRQVTAVAELMARLAEANVAAVPILRSSAGNVVETIDVGGWQVHATLVADVGGASLDIDALTSESARVWGAALGSLHRDGDAASTGLDLPDGWEQIEQVIAGFADHAVLGEVVAAVRSRLTGMSRQAGCYGLVHGDFELDNLAWLDGIPIAYDFDEAERSWFVADIAYALRDLVREPSALGGAPSGLLAAFLDGYRQEHSALVVDSEQLVLFTAVNALRSLARLAPVLAEDPQTGPDLVAMASGKPLRSVLTTYAAQQQRIAVDLIALLR
jgi:Ser/Thr protein kinase RdoA (MazF antagonist)